ncbi:HlyD family type I secretion periplasmic adaptor subunit [Elioraea sp.]|uniref:HlyD family type I secretion periplasmic adaptor subunit n=1 Tax=Elioraea sp. TaxID=2185103 RepID=UPI003F727DDF
MTTAPRHEVVALGGRSLAPVGLGSLGAAEDTAPPPRPPTGGATLLGIAVLAVLLGGFGSWAALAPLAEAAAGPGVITVEGNRRAVQHLEGGIIREILVRDGDRVAAGQVLMRLDDIQAGAQLVTLLAQRAALLAHDARLSAELASADRIAWPPELAGGAGDPRIADLLTGQTALFVSRQTAFASARAVLEARMEQLRAQIASAQSQIGSHDRQIALIRDEMRGVAELLRLGLERRPRLLALQRAEASLIGNRDDLVSQIARSEAGLAETAAQLQAQADQRAAEISLEQRQVRDRLVEIEERLREARDVATRREIVAPIAGTVLNLRFFTIGGVVRPGEPVLEIVPAEDRLIAEVLIQPTDIDVVRPGLQAEVRLPAFKQRLAPFLNGRVVFVSADAVFDERLRASMYRAHVTIDEAELSRLDGVLLTPGMPVEVMILVGERTVWQYLTQPLRDSFVRAFREQ